ncbi:MAG TPA: hypothetical protein VNT58_00250 [Gaiellaceae bacterium]|nr:hypothetical protein [Gaiellaceae bacterium]
MFLFPRKLLYVVWIVIGVVVASQRNYLDDLETIRRIVSAVLAVLLWPLLLLGIDLRLD